MFGLGRSTWLLPAHRGERARRTTWKLTTCFLVVRSDSRKEIRWLERKEGSCCKRLEERVRTSPRRRKTQEDAENSRKAYYLPVVLASATMTKEYYWGGANVCAGFAERLGREVCVWCCVRGSVARSEALDRSVCGCVAALEGGRRVVECVWVAGELGKKRWPGEPAPQRMSIVTPRRPIKAQEASETGRVRGKNSFRPKRS
jgi:hypothetical protein